jgi:hypothetical protein
MPQALPRIAVTIEARAHDCMIVVVGTFIETSLLILWGIANA